MDHHRLRENSTQRTTQPASQSPVRVQMRLGTGMYDRDGDADGEITTAVVMVME